MHQEPAALTPALRRQHRAVRRHDHPRGTDRIRLARTRHHHPPAQPARLHTPGPEPVHRDRQPQTLHQPHPARTRPPPPSRRAQYPVAGQPAQQTLPAQHRHAPQADPVVVSFPPFFRARLDTPHRATSGAQQHPAVPVHQKHAEITPAAPQRQHRAVRQHDHPRGTDRIRLARARHHHPPAQPSGLHPPGQTRVSRDRQPQILSQPLPAPLRLLVQPEPGQPVGLYPAHSEDQPLHVLPGDGLFDVVDPQVRRRVNIQIGSPAKHLPHPRSPAAQCGAPQPRLSLPRLPGDRQRDRQHNRARRRRPMPLDLDQQLRVPQHPQSPATGHGTAHPARARYSAAGR